MKELERCHDCDEFQAIYCQSCWDRHGAEQFYSGAQAARDELKDALKTPSCSTCKHGSWSEDRSVGIWLHLDDCPHLPEDFNLEAEYSSDEECYVQTAAACHHWELNPDCIGPRW